MRNLSHTPSVHLERARHRYPALARVVDDEEEQALARRMLFDKYSPRYGGSLERWRDTALVVAVDLPEAF